MYTPDEMIKRIYRHMSQQSWIAALATIISGYACHIFILTNELFNHDDLGGWLQPQDYVISTRWLQSIFMHLVSPIGSGVMAGTLTIVIISISALLLVDTLGIKSKVNAAIIGMMMICSPIVASFMSYVNGSYLFCVGIPFAILTVRWFEKGIKGYIFSCISLMCAIAGYQSNISITVAIFYIVLFIRLIDKDEELKKWWLTFFKATGVLVIGLVLYFISNQILAGTSISDPASAYNVGIESKSIIVDGYSGQINAGVLYIDKILYTVEVSYKYWIKYNFNLFFEGANYSFASKINVISSVILLICSGIILVKVLLKKDKFVKKIVILVVLLAAPVCINFTEIVLNGKFDETMQMMYSMVITTPLVIVLLEKGEQYIQNNSRIYNIILNVSVLAFIIHAYGNCQIVNDSYQRMNSQYETAYGEMCRIIDRIEQLPEWQEGNRKLYFDSVSGYLINNNYQAFVEPYERYIDMKWLGVIGTQVHYFWWNPNIGNYVKCYFGLNFESPSNEEIQLIKDTKEYQSLEMFPSKNAVKVINDIIVVRL